MKRLFTKVKVIVGLAAIALVILIRLFVGEICSVNSPSMEQTIIPGDWLWIDKYTYGGLVPKRLAEIPLINAFTWIPALLRADEKNDWGYHRIPGFRQPELYDVIVFRSPENDALLLVKRIVSVAKKGKPLKITPVNMKSVDSLIMQDGGYPLVGDSGLYVNGIPDSCYTPKRNYYFVMGDNRDNSRDSRTFGYISEQAIVGRMNRVLFSVGDEGIRNERFWKEIK